jgi:thiamine kinase-like enzyme
MFYAYTTQAREYHCLKEIIKFRYINFDGERAWLVDWEAAFLNDRYFDLDVVANFKFKVLSK